MVSVPCSFALFPFPDRSLSLCAPAHQHPLRGRLFLLSRRIPSAVSIGECSLFVHFLPLPDRSSLCGPEPASAPREVAPFLCRDISLPLRPPEVSNLQPVALLPCPDRSLLSRPSVPLARPHPFRLNERPLALSQRCIDPAHAPPPCFAIRRGPQRLGRCNGGFISPASRSDAGSALGHGKCCAHDRRRFPSSVRQRPRVRLPLAYVPAFTTVAGSRSHSPHGAAHV